MAGGVSIGPRIQVDGEEKYRQQINAIVQQAKTLDAEMGALTASFASNASEQEKATASSKLLNEQLETARKRTELVREMTEKAAAATGEDSTQTLKWRQALAAAEEQQFKLEHAVEENSKAIANQGDAMQDAGEKTVGLGDSLERITGKLGIQIPDAAKEALSGMEGFSAGTVATMATAAGAIAGIYKVGKELFDLTRQAAAEADALITRSSQTGIDTSTLQGLDYASRFLDFEGIDKSLQRLTASMASARDGADKQSEAFRRLGVEIYNEDGSLRNNWETFLDAIDALGRMENATERDTVANDLFGKSYADLKPLIDAGTGALQSCIDEAERLGYVVEDEVLEKLGRLDDAMQKNEASSTALKNQIAGDLAPGFTLLVDGATAAQDALRGLLDNDVVAGILDFVSPTYAMVGAYNAFADAVYNVKEKQSDAAVLLDALAQKQAETAEKQREAIATMQEAVAELADEYNKTYEASLTSMEGQFGQWEIVSGIAKLSIEDMSTALESQTAYYEIYGQKLDALLNRNVEGVAALAADLDGSRESAATLEAYSQMSDEELAAIVEKQRELSETREALARKFADLDTDFDNSLNSIKENYKQTVTDINGETGKIDFSPLQTAVDEAFDHVDWRADETVRYVNEQLQALMAGIQVVGSVEKSEIIRDTNVGYNAAGTESWRGGLTWLGEGGPELVELPRGARIYSHQESMQMLAANGGTDTRRMEALLERSVALQERIVSEFSGRRVMGRMV